MSSHPARISAAALLARLGGAVHHTPQPGPTAALITLGALGPLPCWWGTATPGATLSLARSLARRGSVGLLIGDELRGRRRTLSVSVTPVRAAVIERDRRDALPLLRLAQLRPDDSLLATAYAAASAIDVDASGRRAFRALRSGIDTAVVALPGNIGIATRRAWVLLQVTRLLFLRFVEAEGWLDGRDTFLRDAIDQCLGRRGDVERHLLAPLFFGTLNRPAATRTRRARAFGVIPFLNGGLFEPHPLERKRTWSLPTPAWCALFDLLVNAFEVTLDGDDPGDRVNPELLGRVFEGLMADDVRKANGTFYTPVELVPAVLHEAFACHLAPILGRSEVAIAEQLQDPDPALSQALGALRVLDPAVGSGAFLVGALKLMAGPVPEAARVRQIVTRRLFGVDREPAAVRHTELRLWLELLRTMRGRETSAVAPLPNLDTTIRAGNALLDPFAGIRIPASDARRLDAARRSAASSHGAARRTAVSALRRIEHHIACTALAERIDVLRERIGDLLDQARSHDLFGEQARLGSHPRHQVLLLRRELATARRDYRRLQLGGDAAAFGIETAFAAVLARGGFDLVIGNPPWVRAERLPAAERAALRQRYRWWRGSGTGWQHAPDLAVAFVERSVDLLAADGTAALLLPAKLATADYAVRCRAALTHHHTVRVVADLEDDPRAGFQATTYPMALIAHKRPPAPHHQIRIGLGRGRTALQATWRDEGIWTLGDDALHQLARRLRNIPSLAEQLTASLGVKTGANAVFLDPPDTFATMTRIAVQGRDVRPLTVNAKTSMLWPADPRGKALARLPAAVARYLEPHRPRLEARSDQVGAIWWQMFRTETATAPWRVIWSDLASRLRAAALPDPAMVPLNSCYVTALPTAERMYALAAWLNAAPIRALARLGAEPAANNHARFGARAVGRVPLPPTVLDQPLLTKLGRGPWSEATAAAIDTLAAQCLDLTASEQEAVDAFVATGG